MNTPYDDSKFDQAAAELADKVPPMLWRFYSKLMEQGFEESQSMELTAVFLDGTMNQGHGG